MQGISLLQLISYLSIAIFGVTLITKAVKYATTPIHLRWELYPVAHEKGREYGGSYFEEVDWWMKPRQKSIIGEIKYMMLEIFFMKELYNRNRGLWYFSYTFHLGLYLLVIWFFLLFAGGIMNYAGFFVSPESQFTAVRLLHKITITTGVIGMLMGTMGCISLILKRALDEELKINNTPVEYFNLLFILVILLSGISSWYFSDPEFSKIRNYAKSLLTVNPATVNDFLITMEITLFSVFIIYMPFSRMIHFIAKYFTYHKVRWDDEPNLRGSAVEEKVKRVLDYPISWNAPHIKPCNKWSDIPSSEKE